MALGHNSFPWVVALVLEMDSGLGSDQPGWTMHQARHPPRDHVRIFLFFKKDSIYFHTKILFFILTCLEKKFFFLVFLSKSQPITIMPKKKRKKKHAPGTPLCSTRLISLSVPCLPHRCLVALGLCLSHTSHFCAT